MAGAQRSPDDRGRSDRGRRPQPADATGLHPSRAGRLVDLPARLSVVHDRHPDPARDCARRGSGRRGDAPRLRRLVRRRAGRAALCGGPAPRAAARAPRHRHGVDERRRVGGVAAAGQRLGADVRRRTGALHGSAHSVGVGGAAGIGRRTGGDARGQCVCDRRELRRARRADLHAHLRQLRGLGVHRLRVQTVPARRRATRDRPDRGRGTQSAAACRDHRARHRADPRGRQPRDRARHRRVDGRRLQRAVVPGYLRGGVALRRHLARRRPLRAVVGGERADGPPARRRRLPRLGLVDRRDRRGLPTWRRPSAAA